MTILSITVQEALNYGVYLQTDVKLQETKPGSLQDRVAVREILGALAEFQIASRENIVRQEKYTKYQDSTTEQELAERAWARFKASLDNLRPTYVKTGIVALTQ